MSTTDELRPELPPLTDRIGRLRLERGYPVPWFVAQPPNHPTVEFRAMDTEKLSMAMLQHRCWVCGGDLGTRAAYVVGPMCTVNRISAEPPSHRDCAEWSLQACPFLTRPHARRRPIEGADLEEQAAGIALERNPGCMALWATSSQLEYTIDAAKGLPLFHLPEPFEVTWWREGRLASRQEATTGLSEGFHALLDKVGPLGESDKLQLELALGRALELLPNG